MSMDKKDIVMIDSSDLAGYILVKGGSMSHLKLQKILFYVQAYHLAYFDQPIIDDSFEAWAHGPVSRKIFKEARGVSLLHTELEYVQGPGEVHPEMMIRMSLTPSQIELVNDVIDELKDLSGLQLENMTHSEYPWIFARRGYAPGERCDVVIPNNLIRDYYKDHLV